MLFIIFQVKDSNVNGSLEEKDDEKEVELGQESILRTDIFRLQGMYWRLMCSS